MITIEEFSYLHSLYTAVAEKELGHPVPSPQGVPETLAEKDPSAASKPVSEPLRQWLALLDLAVNPHLLRGHVKEQGTEEPTIRALIRFLVSKKLHTQDDRDKLDWLVPHLFKVWEERNKVPTGWPKAEVLEILRGFDFPPVSRHTEELLMEIPSLLDEVKYFETFSQITDSHVIQRGRDLKNQFEDEFFHPDVLAAIANYNLLFGKKFHELFQETMQKVREFARALPEQVAPDAKELLRSDYRSTMEAFRRLGELGQKEAETKAPAASAPAPAPASLEQHLKHLGVDSSQEVLNLHNRIEELTIRLRASLGITSIPNPFTPLPLHEWESTAFRTDYAESEQTFRAEFARSVRQAVAIVSRIYEEIPLYHQKKGTEFLWKKHYDALVYLLYEGREHKESLLRLAALSRQRGLLEKAKQLQATAEKLEAGLAKVAALF